jgi:hypothetical protein
MIAYPFIHLGDPELSPMKIVGVGELPTTAASLASWPVWWPVLLDAEE